MIRHETRHQLNARRDNTEREYDFIVIGAGASGAIVANRLADDRQTRVLLLEAGPANSVSNDIPALYDSRLNSEYDWNYTNAEQQYGVAFVNRTIPENSGLGLRGGSNLNAMIFNRRDYDK